MATAKKAAPKASAAEKIIQDITNRYRVTAREARDIVTAVGNFGAIARDKANTGAEGGVKKQIGSAVKNLKTQVSEAGKAATSGKKGTPSKQYMTVTGEQPQRLVTPNKTTKNGKNK